MKKIDVDTSLSVTEISKTYNVSMPTASRAKKRGWVAVNYHGDQSSPVIKKGDLQKFKRLVEHPVINIRQLTSIPEQKIHDILAGKSSLRENDWAKFKSEFAEIRNLIREVIEATNTDYVKKKMNAVYDDARIKPFVLFQNKRMLDRLRKGQSVYKKEVIQTKNLLKDFLNKTQL